jgi:hypothetical protein
LSDLPLGLLLAVLLVVPPAGCVVWYLLWSRLYPDAARLARQRRSLAARKALHALEHAGSGPAREQATRTAAILADYLRHRLDLPGGEATPAEVADHLQRAGYSTDLASKTAEFFRACDAVRFMPVPTLDGNLSATGGELILALEAESCPLLAS